MRDLLGAKTNAVITVAAVMIIIYGVQAAKVIIVPFLLAGFLALITVRPMLWMQDRRVPAFLAAMIILSGILLLLFVIVTIVGTSVGDFAAALPTYQARLDSIVQGLLELVSRLTRRELSMEGLRELADPAWALRMAATILVGTREVLTNAFLVFFTMVFILLDASGIPTKIRAAFGEEGASFTGQENFLDNLGRYLGIKTAVSLMTGICAGLVTGLIGLDFPLLWGMLAFLLNYIPTIGSIIAAIPAVLLAVIQLGWPAAGATAAGFLGINIVFGNFLEPRLMGHGVGISPLVVFTGLFFWGFILGPVGMLLSVPLTMTVKMALEINESTRWIAIVIGSERDAEHVLAQQDGRGPEPEPGTHT
ncbi:MAG: AI-2E family transporter [Chromatiales bacterium]|nr:MAG: AI-2E family transporter [Chromatiales bacterium]